MLFSIDYQDIHVRHVIGAISHELLHPQALFGSIGESLLRVNNERHLSGVAPDGTPWEPLKESSKLEKRKGGPLNKTYQMLASFNYQASDQSLFLGFDGDRNATLAFWHNGGTDPYVIRPKNGQALKFGDHVVKKVNHPGLPERQLVGYPESDQQLVGDVIDDHFSLVMAPFKV